MPTGGQNPFDFQYAAVATLPFQFLQLDTLPGPDRRHVRMSKIEQSEVRPDRFRNVAHHVAGGIPRCEYADLGFSLRFDGALQEGYIEARDIDEDMIVNHTGLERKKYANALRMEWCENHHLPKPDYPEKIEYNRLKPFVFGPKR